MRRTIIRPPLIRFCPTGCSGQSGSELNVDIDGGTIWKLFLALLPSFFGLTAFRISLDLLAERSGGDSFPAACVSRLLEANEHSLLRPSPADSTPQEFAESESEERDEDDRHHLVMSFSELLSPSGRSPFRAMLWPPGRPAPLVAAPLSLLSQRLVC